MHERFLLSPVHKRVFTDRSAVGPAISHSIPSRMCRGRWGITPTPMPPLHTVPVPCNAGRAKENPSHAIGRARGTKSDGTGQACPPATAFLTALSAESRGIGGMRFLSAVKELDAHGDDCATMYQKGGTLVNTQSSRTGHNTKLRSRWIFQAQKSGGMIPPHPPSFGHTRRRVRPSARRCRRLAEGRRRSATRSREAARGCGGYVPHAFRVSF